MTLGSLPLFPSTSARALVSCRLVLSMCSFGGRPLVSAVITPVSVVASLLKGRLYSMYVTLSLSLSNTHTHSLALNQQVIKRSGVSPDFDSEKLVFDIVEPDEFVVGGDVSLSIEIWDDSAWSDDLLASVHLSALR